MTVHKDKLDNFERYAGLFSTPLKYLSSMIDGPSAWRDTGCNASGIGTPVWGTQHSTDDLYTIDVQIQSAEVNGVPVPAGRYVRLEILPGWPAHAAVARHPPAHSDLIVFHGFLVWDKDKRPPDHRDGHMEIHPVEPIQFVDGQH